VFHIMSRHAGAFRLRRHYRNRNGPDAVGGAGCARPTSLSSSKADNHALIDSRCRRFDCDPLRAIFFRHLFVIFDAVVLAVSLRVCASETSLRSSFTSLASWRFLYSASKARFDSSRSWMLRAFSSSVASAQVSGDKNDAETVARESIISPTIVHPKKILMASTSASFNRDFSRRALWMVGGTGDQRGESATQTHRGNA